MMAPSIGSSWQFSNWQRQIYHGDTEARRSAVLRTNVHSDQCRGSSRFVRFSDVSISRCSDLPISGSRVEQARSRRAPPHRLNALNPEDLISFSDLSLPGPRPDFGNTR